MLGFLREAFSIVVLHRMQLIAIANNNVNMKIKNFGFIIWPAYQLLFSFLPQQNA